MHRPLEGQGRNGVTTIGDRGGGGGGYGVCVYGFGPPRLGVGDLAKISLFRFFLNITIHDFITMLVFVFCKLFEKYSQTNIPILKTKPYKGNKI